MAARKNSHFEPVTVGTALPVMRRLRTRYDRTADGDWFKAYRCNSYRTSSNSPVTAQRWQAPAPFSKGKPLLLLYDSALLPKPINM